MGHLDPMIERLTRIALAFAVAFVFAGRMEAAAAHCAQLAQQGLEAAAPVAVAASAAMEDGASCHEGSMAQKAETPAKTSAPMKHHDKPITHCDCIGVLKVFASVGAAARSAHIEPYEWARPEAAQFASIEPSPGLRPPRA